MDVANRDRNNMDENKIIEHINLLRSSLDKARSVFPHFDETSIGGAEFTTADYYVQKGHKVTFKFDTPLTEKRIEELNAIGHWLNESYIDRLFSILDSHSVISNSVKIDWDLPGSEEVDLVRRLRQRIAHANGRYNPADKEQKQLFEKLVTKFNITSVDIDKAASFPLNIDQVIDPLTYGCVEYIKKFCEKYEK